MICKGESAIKSYVMFYVLPPDAIEATIAIKHSEMTLEAYIVYIVEHINRKHI